MLLALLLPLPAALTQPYAAQGGFDRPREVGGSTSSMRFAVAGSDDGPVAFWSDNNGILSSNLSTGSAPERIVEGRGIRELAATEVNGEAALAWARRDLGTGRARHWLRWQDEQVLLLDTLQPYEMSLAAAPSGPAVLMARGEGGDTILRLHAWGSGDTVIRTSTVSLVRYRAVFDEAGRAYVFWLEGFRDHNAVGFASDEWTAYLATVDPHGTVSAPVELGPASYQGGAGSQTVLALSEGEPRVLWPGPGGQVLFAGPDREPIEVGEGSAVGLADGLAYWADGSSVRSRRPTSSSEPINVVWSPISIQRGKLVESGGDNYLAWYGPMRSGKFGVFASDDGTPFQPTLLDRIAAAMGWSPWGIWQAFIGQVLGSLLAASLICMALTPIVWVGAMIAVRANSSASSSLGGISVGLVILLVPIALTWNQVPRSVHRAIFGTVPELVACLLLAGAATWLLRWRSDSEPLIGTMGSAWLFLFLGMSSLGFLTFQSWLEIWPALT